MYAGLSVLQQAAEYGYSSTVYAPQPRDVQLQMPSWAWFLVTVAVLSISVAGDFRAQSPLTTVHVHETIRAHTAQATICMVLFLCLLIQIRLPQCSPQHQVLTHPSGPQYKPRPDLTEDLSLQASSLQPGIPSTGVSLLPQYFNPLLLHVRLWAA